MTLTSIFILLIAYQFKHFLADFPLQSPYMLQKFKDKGWVMPLAAHAGLHAYLTFIIAGGVALSSKMTLPTVLLVTALDFVVHFTMDRIKASSKMLGRYKCLAASEFPQIMQDKNSSSPTAVMAAEAKLLGNKLFWWSLGIDQMVHHLTHYAIIWILIHAV